MRRVLSFAGILAVVALTAACAKGPAEAALKAADASIESVKAQAEPFVPEQFAALQADATAARELFNKGDYKGTVEAANAIPAKAQEVLTAAQTRKDELTKSFTEVSSSVPTLVQAVTTKVAELKGKAPKGMDKASFDTATAAVASLGPRWAEITNSFQGGDILSAVEKAKSFKTEVEGLAAQLGVTTPTPAPVPAPGS